MKRLCVLGSLHLDVVVGATHLPQVDETVVGSEVNYISGGKGGADEKIEKMKSCGILIAESPAKIGKTLHDKLAR